MLMFMTGLFPFATYALPALAGLILVAMVVCAVVGVLILRFAVPQSKQRRPSAHVSPNRQDGPDAQDSPKAVVLRILRALMHHRFSVAMVIPLAITAARRARSRSTSS